MRRRTSSASDGSQGATTTQSPRALATREKNREAVRKCRQRKRERTEELKQRCEELSKENVRLRMRLELGNEEACQEKLAKGKQLVAEMSRLLKGLDGKLADREKTPHKDALDVVYQQFFERHMELGPDKLASLSFVVKRLHGLIEPDPLTKAYLFILSLEDDCFNEAESSSESGEEINWWREFCKELDLSEEQKRQFRLRRLTGRRTKAELFYVAQRAQSMSQAIVDRKQLAQSFVEMMKGFTHAQLAKFVVWVSTDPCGNELLDMLWTELIASIDADLEKERAQQENKDVRAHEVQNLLNAVRLENGRLFKTLFEVGDIQDSFRNARRIFTEDVVLVDPSNGGEYRGLEQVMRYVDKMRRAFTPVRPDGKTSSPSLNINNPPPPSHHNSSGVVVSPQDPLSSTGIKFEEKSLEFTGDKAIGKFHIYGSYHGKLLESSSPSRNHQESIMVECESVVDITFADSSAKIKELVVTTDLLGLFQSLGSKIEVPQPQSDSALPAPSVINLGDSAMDDNDDSNPTGDEIVEQMNTTSPRTSEKKRFPFSPDSMDDGEVLEGRALESASLTQASELDLRKREHILAELRGLFELEDLSEAYRLAGRILADRCVFVDSNMGTDHRGIDECFAYVKRIRSAFPKMRIVQEAFDRDVKQPGERIRIEWMVDAEYGGKLVSQQTTKPCSLRGTLFLTMDPEQGEIVSNLAMSWNATSLLRELGVQLNDQRTTLRRHSSAS